MNTVNQFTDDELQEAIDLDCPPADDFLSLDDLLSEATADIALTERAKAAKKLLATQSGTMSKSRKASLQGEVSQYETKRNWTPVANVAMFDVQVCTYCSARHRHFMGILQEQTHNTSKVTRWVQVTKAENLPQTVKENLFPVAMCGSCCSTKGWV
jgi:sulfur relay (sulfurtransferase) complex TusBCD TusD component (DsrE family)